MAHIPTLAEALGLGAQKPKSKAKSRKNYVRHRETVKHAYRNECLYCGAHGSRGKTTLTLDHVIPRSGGGSDNKENLALACADCNSKKGSMSFVDFVARHNPQRRMAILDRVLELARVEEVLANLEKQPKWQVAKKRKRK